jgi:hypothetical protein
MLDTTTHRWLQEDPIQFKGGDANLYRDVGNDPTNMTDPSGLQAKPADKPPPEAEQLPFANGTRVSRAEANDKLADRVFTVGSAAQVKVTVSAALEKWRRDDSEEEKNNPTEFLSLTATVGDDLLSRSLLNRSYWLQIGKINRFKDKDAEKAGKDSNSGGKFAAPRFPDGAIGVASEIPFGKDFLDGPLSGSSPYMTDTPRSPYRRTKTSLTFWDAPEASGQLDKDHQVIVATYSAFLVFEGQVLYEVDWGVRNQWNGEGKSATREYIGPTGSIPKELPPFLAKSGQKLLVGTGKGLKDIENPIKGIESEIKPEK